MILGMIIVELAGIALGFAVTRTAPAGGVLGLYSDSMACVASRVSGRDAFGEL